MPRPRIDLTRKIKDIVQHVEALPAEASAPLPHYRHTSTDIWNSLQYVERHFAAGNRYRSVAERHIGRLYGMAFVSLAETFERFLKEVAAACVDCLAEFILDDRFNVFKIQGSALAAHIGTDTVGRALCEAGTWLDCDEINDRFRRVLADPFEQGNFYLFPKKAGQPPEDERWRFEPMSIVWQIRHTAVHNVGVITQSDGIKLRLLAKEDVQSPRMLSPTRDDIRYLKRFLDETAEGSNKRIGKRLAELLSTIYAQAPVLFVAQEIADDLTQTFGFPLTVGSAVGFLPPP